LITLSVISHCSQKKIKPQPQFSMTRTSNRRGGRGDKPEKGGSGASKATTGGTEKKSHTLTIKNSTLTGLELNDFRQIGWNLMRRRSRYFIHYGSDVAVHLAMQAAPALPAGLAVGVDAAGSVVNLKNW
jgi:hypothetical protein